MFNNLTKVTKILTKKKSKQQLLFHFSRSTSSIKIFSKCKKSGSIKDCLEINLQRKKELNFAKYDLVEFLELSMVTNASNTLNTLVDMKWTWDLGMKKTFILLDTIYIVFFSERLLLITCSYAGRE